MRTNILINKISEAIILGVQRNGERVFHTSQQDVPVDTGNLKMSGRKINNTEGYEITYDAKDKKGFSYADIVEEGIPYDIPIKGNQIIHRKGYIDKKGKYHPPKDITYKNKRVVFIKTRKMLSAGTKGKGPQTSVVPVGFRVISKISARKGYFFIRNSFEKEITTNLGNDVKFYLSKIKGVTVS